MGGTRPADRPASAGRWGRQASTDHSHGDGEGAVDAVLFTVQDPRTTRHRRVPTSYGPARAPENCETRGINGLTARPGIGPVSAAQVIVSFSHPGRCRNDAAFAALGGISPLQASSGRVVRHRLNRGGDRALNK